MLQVKERVFYYVHKQSAALTFFPKTDRNSQKNYGNANDLARDAN